MGFSGYLCIFFQQTTLLFEYFSQFWLCYLFCCCCRDGWAHCSIYKRLLSDIWSENFFPFFVLFFNGILVANFGEELFIYFFFCHCAFGIVSQLLNPRLRRDVVEAGTLRVDQTTLGGSSRPPFPACILHWGSSWRSSIAHHFAIVCLVQLFASPVDCSPPGSSLHGILQVRILEWVAIPFSRGSSQPRDQTWVSCIVGRHFTIWATREASLIAQLVKNLPEIL